MLNGEPVYTRVWETQEEALADSDAALRDLVCAGWQRIALVGKEEPIYCAREAAVRVFSLWTCASAR